MAELSNNPFIDHSASALSRFPNINAVSSPTGSSAPQYSNGWPQQQQQQQQSPSGYLGANPTGYTQQYFQQQQWPQQQQQQQQQQYQQQLQAPYPPTNFQSPQSPGSYGQQFVGQVNPVNPVSTGYPQLQMQGQYTDYATQQAASYSYQQPQQTGYGYPPHQQQQQHQQQQLLAQFDPYANLGQQLSPQASAASISPITNGAVGSPPPGVQHPRMFIHTHKAELEAWDPPTWRQVQSVFETLKTAWETRKRAAEAQVRALGGIVGAPPSSASATGFFGGAGQGAYGAYGGGYQTPQAQEVDRLNSLIKEANTNIDIVAAAALQMSEVFSGYRHSGDMASKRRVRESCNAAVTGLPEYPPSTL